MIFIRLFAIIIFCAVFSPLNAQKKEFAVPADSLPYTLRSEWKYSIRDDPSFSAISFDDSKWKTVIPSLRADKIDECGFNGFALFRLHLSIPNKFINTPMVLGIWHLGASEIYIDGQKIAAYGKVSLTGEGEERLDPEGVFLPVVFRDSSTHIIAVRYSNHKFVEYSQWDDFRAGFSITLDTDQNQTFAQLNSLFKINIFLLCVGGFLFALTFMHVFFYVFYRKQKYHLYYSIFTFFFALFFFLPYFSINLFDPDITEPLGYFFPMVVPVYFISLASFTYYLILEKLPRTFWLTVITGLVIISGFFWKNGINEIFYAVLIFLVITQTSKAIGQGKKMKKEGLTIIRWGHGIFMFFLAYVGISYFAAVSGLINSGILINQNTIYFLLPGVLSIPVSISMYMARNFATLNINLEKKLLEVEELSAKNLAQEKEKQQILAQQNVMLEQKVEERTAEVVKQKELLEEKQKEILDSIRYAKRIQMALLPSDKYIDRIMNLFKKGK